ncbi:hypothetical protein [Spirillospora sp. CA-294931]|uniref:hypothetical protein n=1 Tax=Spirillospora sp. CA-294931 TaxID=3240042 RepID=UPI003D911392
MDDVESAAREQVRPAGGSTGRRLRLAAGYYPAHGPLAGYGRAELSFLRWLVGRGVLNPPGATPPGSPWWRAVSDRMLRDKAEAALLCGGRRGEPSSRPVELWTRFVRDPSPSAWYRAHNASVVAGYLGSRAHAEDELPAERFMMNVALVRVLYAHALVAAPRLALGRFSALGPRLADPRHGSVGLFLDLRRAFPERYPLTGVTVEDLMAAEGPVPRALDYGVIAPRLAGLYEFAAASLGEPRVADLFRDGSPSYVWPAARHWVWSGDGERRLLTRLTALAVGARSRA